MATLNAGAQRGELVVAEVHEQLDDLREPALAAPFFESWAQANPDLIPLAVTRWVGYKVPLFPGGKDTLDNLEVIDLEVYWSVSGQLRGAGPLYGPGLQWGGDHVQVAVGVGGLAASRAAGPGGTDFNRCAAPPAASEHVVHIAGNQPEPRAELTQNFRFWGAIASKPQLVDRVHIGGYGRAASAKGYHTP